MFTWNFPYPSQRMPVLAKNVVATSQPLAAQAGLAMLAKGGNAVDAGLAAAITLTVVEPTSNGIGSDAFAILWDGQRLVGLNASGRSPAGWTPERFAGKKAMPTLGWDSVTVPGLRVRVGDALQALRQAAVRGRCSSPRSATRARATWSRRSPRSSWAQPGARTSSSFSEFCWTFLPKDRAPLRRRALLLPAAGRDARGDRRHQGRELLPRRARRAHRARQPAPTTAR